MSVAALGLSILHWHLMPTKARQSSAAAKQIVEDCHSVPHSTRAEGAAPKHAVDYQMCILSSERWPTVVLTDVQFAAIKQAKCSVFVLMGIEEKFEIVLENYADYERELLSLGLKTMLHDPADYDSAMDDIQLLNRRIINVLTATRLYVDQTKHGISELFGKPSPMFSTIEGEFRREYDSVLGYRVMEKLRNHVQHRDLPVRRLKYPSRWVGEGQNVYRRCGVKPELDLQFVREDTKNFSRSFIQQMETSADPSDITRYVREFVAALSRVHERVRLQTAEVAVAARKLLVDSISMAETKIGHLVGLAAVSHNRDEPYSETIYLAPDHLRRLDAKLGTSRNLTNLSRWYVSGELTD